MRGFPWECAYMQVFLSNSRMSLPIRESYSTGRSKPPPSEKRRCGAVAPLGLPPRTLTDAR